MASRRPVLRRPRPPLPRRTRALSPSMPDRRSESRSACGPACTSPLSPTPCGKQDPRCSRRSAAPGRAGRRRRHRRANWSRGARPGAGRAFSTSCRAIKCSGSSTGILGTKSGWGSWWKISMLSPGPFAIRNPGFLRFSCTCCQFHICGSRDSRTGKSAPVNPISPETEREKLLWQEAENRIIMRKKKREERNRDT
ncbi:uncharacterized protein LOC104457102 [Eucalyptus grandis]|uniref:uncharacterized protein LOC104457102 n=1 Tax=Eucalyptus grandis TaxID=71139 RepID=UPI00192F08BF|nr:uncharacterized protein LOC104457102 [Eucalyptus grandis]